MEDVPRKFVCDVMLGRLARWLRVLGYSAAYFRQIDDDELAAYAREKGLFLITRDTRIVERSDIGPHLLLVENDSFEQLKLVVARLGLRVDRERAFSRCVECNEPLAAVEKSEIRGLVPPFVYSRQDRFSRCPSCGRIYWPATHHRKMLDKLDEVFGENRDGRPRKNP